MKIKPIITVLALSTGLIMLTGCSTMSRSHNGGAPVSNATGATTVGMGGEEGFQGTGAGRLKAPANQTYYFSYDKSDVQQNDYASIAAQGRYLSTHPSAKVRVEGNTDNRGSREYNIGLGWRRANAVKAVLEQYGATKNQIITFSWGAEKPKALGNSESAYQQNRRVDLVYKAY